MVPVMLYQMGKVGSSTLKHSLNKFNVDNMHVHRFYFSHKERPLSIKDRLQKLKHNYLMNKFLNNKKQEFKIITFYRDPLPRNISSFFQNLEYYFTSKELAHLDYETLVKAFNNSNQIHETPNNWFDLEFKRKTGIDIFKHPFDKEKGYSVIKNGHVSVFVCTTNNINNLESELGAFLDIPKFKIYNDNVGDQKWYKDLYAEFKKNYQPSKAMIDSLYNSNTIHHFYSENEIHKLKNKWLNELKEVS